MGERVSKILEAFAEAVAAAGPQPGAIKANGTFLYVHCPLPGPENDPHQAKGEPQVYLWIKDGEPIAHCDKCLGSKDAYRDPAELAARRQRYTDELKLKTGWRPPEKRDTEELRHHNYYDRNLRHVVDHKKVKHNGELKFFWDAAPLDSELKRTERFHSIRAEEFLAEHHPDFDHIYEALHWYGVEALIDEAGTIPFGPLLLRKPEHIAICEGERDCDTFNALGLKGWFATCLSHPKPSALRAHHLPLIKGATAYIVPDKDTAGIEQANNWAGRIWDHCPRILQVNLPLPGGKGKKDLTDWVEAGGTAEQLLQLLMEAEAWINRPLTTDEERSALVLGLAAVKVSYRPLHKTSRGGFYSEAFVREMRFTEIRSNRVILQALEGSVEIPRDPLGSPKREGAFVLWKNRKEAIIGELMQQLPAEYEIHSTTPVADMLAVQIENLLSTMVTLNVGAGEQRRTVIGWARRFAELPPLGRWRGVNDLGVWGRIKNAEFQIAFKPALAANVRCNSLIGQMSLNELRKLCTIHGFCEPKEEITVNGRNVKALTLTVSLCSHYVWAESGESQQANELHEGLESISSTSNDLEDEPKIMN